MPVACNQVTPDSNFKASRYKQHMLFAGDKLNALAAGFSATLAKERKRKKKAEHIPIFPILCLLHKITFDTVGKVYALGLNLIK